MIETEDTANRNIHLAQDDYGIVAWMEAPKTFAAIHGSSDKTKISGKPKVKKIDAFNGLAKHLIGNTKNEALREVELTGRNMQQRWRIYMCRFKKTLNANHTETGLDITRRELARGMPIPQKLEQMCPYYSRKFYLT
ncbi:hypothetical protein F442_00278 [Phytophthora nicotianae P10297]|uniref:Uncharacterized protein n=1 Tax=Phytophthora nicotianae P10297 TaxID=1317064 RepID=W3A6B2_PHYNI|nr:hypothetical protein F442_00278 [Phytophthora nicotianae P10297]